jgi:hypothetical protein
LGSVSFFVGSVFFLPALDESNVGAILFILGSWLFIVGVAIETFQLSAMEKTMTTRYLLCAGFLNLVGSLLFLFGSVPYLLDLSNADFNMVYGIVSGVFVIGTVMFLIGGSLNLIQACAIRQPQGQTGTHIVNIA